MAFKDTILVFTDNEIAIDDGRSVMMSWEAPIMEKSAEYICQSKGDILEIGFGMGICSDYIQAEGVNSHTIVEIHPQIIEKLKVWAEGKDNVIIVEGDWNSVELNNGAYDGIFIDTYMDDSWSQFKDFVLSKAKDGAKVTYWNSGIENEHEFSTISYDEIAITPDDNNYMWNNDIYYMPKVTM